MFYLRRITETIILSIICSFPAYLEIFGLMPNHSIAVGRLQMLLFCIFIFIIYLFQNAIFRYDHRWKYYTLLSIFSYIPFTLITIILYFILPLKIYQLIFMPMIFLDWIGFEGIMSVVAMNIIIYLSIPLAPWLNRILKNRNI